VITLALHLLRLLPFLVGGCRQLALKNLALRQQRAVYKRTLPRPKLRTMDRLVWVGLARVWTGWRQALVIVSPDTVLRWQRRRFREYWTDLSGRPTGGRTPVDAEITALVRKMAAANPWWGAPRIHRELLKLGIDIPESAACTTATSAKPHSPASSVVCAPKRVTGPRVVRSLSVTHRDSARTVHGRRSEYPDRRIPDPALRPWRVDVGWSRASRTRFWRRTPYPSCPAGPNSPSSTFR
jgi:hypothetical protein